MTIRVETIPAPQNWFQFTKVPTWLNVGDVCIARYSKEVVIIAPKEYVITPVRESNAAPFVALEGEWRVVNAKLVVER